MLGSNQAGYPGFSGPFVAGGNPAVDEVRRIELDFEWPGGLFEQTDKGGITSQDTILISEYQELDSLGDPVGGWVEWLDKERVVSTTSALRVTYGFNTPNPEATYLIRTRRGNWANGWDDLRITDAVFWTGLRAVKSTPDNYGNVTLLAVEAQASNSISGSAAQAVNLDFTAYNCAPSAGKLSYTPNRSIVGAFVSVFVNEYGASLDGNVMDWDTLLAIDAEMEAQGRYFDWTFDQPTTVWEAAKAIARCARAHSDHERLVYHDEA